MEVLSQSLCQLFMSSLKNGSCSTCIHSHRYLWDQMHYSLSAVISAQITNHVNTQSLMIQKLSGGSVDSLHV